MTGKQKQMLEITHTITVFKVIKNSLKCQHFFKLSKLIQKFKKQKIKKNSRDVLNKKV